MTAEVRLVINARAARRDAAYGAAALTADGFAAAEREIASWPGYAATPLARLDGRGRDLGLAALWYKDERGRFGLKSFKALGGAYAVRRVLERESRQPKEVTVTCATDGNHGRSVAWGARLFGCNCVIFIHETVSEGRAEAIRRYGADVVRVKGNYDDAVRHAAAEAARHGWFVVSDTSYEGYRDVPVDVMHGYGVMAAEIFRQLPAGEVPTHVFVQVGVGALAAAICARFWLEWGARRPRFIAVEPARADCLRRSIEAGRPVAVHGDLETVMAGLVCGEVSELAWEVLREGTDAALAIDDDWALEAVRALANPLNGDPVVVAGETGGAGLAALLALRERPDLRAQLGLDAGSHVLLLGSEGDTDPEIYRRIVGRSAEELLS
ncbi:MAG TPA: diaminopropionate ammonia-lyase [Burkholderiales bacterium]|nr:diaminopropionate ammonia-lyase [Burkholderiales bacterium]